MDTLEARCSFLSILYPAGCCRRPCLLRANSLRVSFGIVFLFGCAREARGFTAGLRGGANTSGSDVSGGFIDPRWWKGGAKKRQWVASGKSLKLMLSSGGARVGLGFEVLNSGGKWSNWPFWGPSGSIWWPRHELDIQFITFLPVSACPSGRASKV